MPHAGDAARPADTAGLPRPADAAGRARRVRAADPVAWLIALATFAAYTTLSVFKYLRLEAGSWDLGIYTQYVQQFAWLRAPVVTIKGSGFNLLGDHFQPIVALIAPFYRLFPGPVTLLAAQALLAAVSVVPVCRAARVLLGTGASRAIGVAYGFSWGLQEMINFDFHEVAFAVPLLACSLSALVLRRPRAAAMWALPLVFVKEDQGLTVAAIGLVMLASAARAWSRSRRATAGAAPAAASTGHGASTWAWAGGLLVLWGLAWSVLAIAVIIPHFNPTHVYPYWFDGGVVSPHGAHYSAGGLLAQVMQSGPEKLRTTALVLLPVAFLALRSPLVLVAVPSLALRFLATNHYFWGTQWHYSATVMPVVFLAAVDALARLRGRAAAREGAPAARRPLRPGLLAARYGAVAMLVIAVILAFRFPVARLWVPRTYVMSAHVRAENAAMALIPAGTTVESTVSMLAPLATRDVTYWVGTVGSIAPRYVVFDATNSGYSPEPTDVLALVDQQHPGVSYQQIFRQSDVYLFRRDGRTGG